MSSEHFICFHCRALQRGLFEQLILFRNRRSSCRRSKTTHRTASVPFLSTSSVGYEVRRARRKQLCTTTRLLLPQKQSSRCNRRVRPREWSKHWKTFRHGTGVQFFLETCLQKWRASMVEYFRKTSPAAQRRHSEKIFSTAGIW